MISFKTIFDNKYLADGLKAHIKVKLKLLKYLRYISVIFLILFLLISLFSKDSVSLSVSNIIIISMLILFPTIYYYTNTLNFKNNPQYGKELNWEINSELIKGFNDKLNFVVNWEEILEAYKLKNGLIIYKSKNSYYWFPNDNINKDNSVNDIEEIIKSNGLKYSIKS